MRAIQIPIGMPISMQKPTDIPVMIRVSMANDHRSKIPKSNMQQVTRIVYRSPAKT